MKKEFGKWLLDISKYMTTALLISSAFGDMDSLWVVITVVIASIAILLMGLWLVRDSKKEKKEEIK
jgi:hypothetical protein